MKIALVQAPVWWTLDPPLGLAQMAGCLKAAGHEVTVFDMNIRLWSERRPQYENMWLWEQFHFWNYEDVVERFFKDNGESIGKQVEEILRTDAAVIGFSVGLGSQVASRRVAELIKKGDPKRVVVFGGQYYFKGEKAKEIVKGGAVDAVILGAGDEVFPQLVKDVGVDGKVTVREGIVSREGDGGPAPAIKNLDRLAYMDFSGFPLELYADHNRIPFAASRGCVWSCHFCSASTFWPGYSYMSGDRIFAEVRRHVGHRVRFQQCLIPQRCQIEFYDIAANGNVAVLDRFSHLMAESLLCKTVTWKINAIVHPEMTRDRLDRWRSGGCREIVYGIESGSPRVLKMMNKRVDPKLAARVLRDTHEAGIGTAANFMIGYPGETEEDFNDTLSFLRENHQWIQRAYCSATFTSLEEHSYLTGHQDEFGIKSQTGPGAHCFYWESSDGTNTYPVRLDRYRRFRELAISLGTDADQGTRGSLEQELSRREGEFYRYKGEPLRAAESYLRYLKNDPLNDAVRRELAGCIEEIKGKSGSDTAETAERLRQIGEVLNEKESIPVKAKNVRQRTAR